MKRYYFDYAAGTPLDPQVKKVTEPYWSEKYGNPGALHWFGQEASAAVFQARDTIAKALDCSYQEIIFTGSATESNNLALRGITQTVRRLTQKNFSESPCLVRDGLRPKLIVSAIEHESILETARDLEKEGVEVVYLPVDKNGIVDLAKLKAALDERTILISVMYVNNEVGSIQPITEIAKIISDFRNSKHEARNLKQIQNSKNKIQNVSNFDIRISDFGTAYPLFHCDAVQAFNYLDCNVDRLGVDLLTLSAQKIYGPKGAGLLYLRQASGVRRQERLLSPIITGGKTQEYGLRGGTENVPAIVGFRKAVELVEKTRDSENKRLRKLQEYFLAKMSARGGSAFGGKKIAPYAELNGPPLGENRICNNLNFYFSVGLRSVGESQRQKLSVSAQDLLIKLDLAGFAVSPGAACTARTCQPSHVLKAMGFSDERATGSLRFTFGRPTTKRDIDKLLKVIYITLQ